MFGFAVVAFASALVRHGSIRWALVISVPPSLIALGLMAPKRGWGRVVGIEALILSAFFATMNLATVITRNDRVVFVTQALLLLTAFLFEWTPLGRSTHPVTPGTTLPDTATPHSQWVPRLAKAAITGLAVLIPIGLLLFIALVILLSQLSNLTS
jgi:hypothetical protein